MNRRLSVIVPIYNVELVLRQCLDSIYSQIDACDEVILIDDASADASQGICEDYRNKYPDITRFIQNKKQSGPSECRNIGTQNASGEFLFYMDSDDWLAPDTLTRMYAFAKKRDCDIVQIGFYYAYSQYLLTKKISNKWDKEGIVMTRRQAMASLIENGFVNNFIWGKLYKADIVKKYPLKVDVSMGEDAFFQHRVLGDAYRIGVINQPLYYYRQVDNGLSNTFSLRHKGLLEAYEDRFLFLRQNYPELVASHMRTFWRMAYNFYCRSKSEEKALTDYFSVYWLEINGKYKVEFAEALKNQTDYRLYRVHPICLSFYLKVKRLFLSVLYRIGYSEYICQKI